VVLLQNFGRFMVQDMALGLISDIQIWLLIGSFRIGALEKSKVKLTQHLKQYNKKFLKRKLQLNYEHAFFSE
jgi:hypothetical protein